MPIMQNAVADATEFDPHALGIPESTWASILGPSEWWTPDPGPITVVSPHPDDEVFGAGGLMSLMAATHDVRVISVTDGEHAYDTAGDLGATRSAELDLAISCLATKPIQIVRLHLPDGGLAKRQSDLRAALLDTIPKAGTLIVPFEYDGHPDHEVIGAVGLVIGALLNVKVVRYPIWRWHHGSVRDLATQRWVKVFLTKSALAAKVRAMQCFQSQLAPPHVPAIVPAHVLAYFQRPFEAFIS